MHPRQRGVLIALTGTTAWATTGIFISYLLEHYPLQPLTLAFWRDLLIAAALILALRLWQPSALRLTRRDLPFFFGYGFVGLAAFNGLWAFSVKFNGAAVATVLAYSAPAFTVLLGRLALGEALNSRKLLAVGMSLAGCVFVARADAREAWALNPAGILVGLGSGVAFAAYSLAGRWSAGRFASSWTVTAYGFLFAALGLGLTQVRGDAVFASGMAWHGWAILAALAIGPSLAGFGLYTLSLRYLEAGVAGLIAALEPALTAVMALFLLGERLDPLQWLGVGLVLLAAALVQGAGGEAAETAPSPVG